MIMAKINFMYEILNAIHLCIFYLILKQLTNNEVPRKQKAGEDVEKVLSVLFLPLLVKNVRE